MCTTLHGHQQILPTNTVNAFEQKHTVFAMHTVQIKRRCNSLMKQEILK